MRDALARHDPMHATTLYSEASTLLRGGDSVHAVALHALGAASRTGVGDAAGARAAQARADEARATLRAHMPQSLRDGFDAARASAMIATPRAGR